MLIFCSTRENPFLPANFVQRLEQSYDAKFALQEIEGEFLNVAGRNFFDIDVLAAMLTLVAKPIERQRNAISIWRKPVIGARYIAGGDLAWGEKGAFSCFQVMDLQSGEIVAELHARMKSDDVAYEAVKLCQYYNDAYTGVENNSEGKSIVDKMVALGYGNRMFYQDWDNKHPSKPGWHTNETTRP